MHLHQQVDKLEKGASEVAEKQRTISQLLNQAPIMGCQKYPYKQVVEVFFTEDDAAVQQVSINTPGDFAVYATRMAVYPSFRTFTTDQAANGPDDVTYRPCVLTSDEHFAAPRIEADPAAMDLRISVSESFNANGQRVTRELQNGPIPSQLFFSGAKNYRRNVDSGLNAATVYSDFDHGKGLFFIRPWYLPPASALTVQIAPSFAGVRNDSAIPGADTTVKNAYKVSFVLDGFKVQK